MPPKSSFSKTPRGRPAGSKNRTASSSTTASKKPSAVAKGKQPAQPSESPEPNRGRDDNGDDDDNSDEAMEEAGDDDDEEPEKTIPPELLTRILHEFFEKDGTRITKDANSSVAKYMDIFVKEAIARAAAERDGGFLEVSTAIRHLWSRDLTCPVVSAGRGSREDRAAASFRSLKRTCRRIDNKSVERCLQHY